jgi:hypothetical protein
MPYRIHGRLVDTREGRALAGLKVEAWDWDVRHHDLLGVAQTGRDGTFLIAFDERHFTDHPADHAPDVFFRVFEGERLVHTTETAPRRNLPPGRHEFTLRLDPAVLEHTSPVDPGPVSPAPVVAGRLVAASGLPAEGVTLRFYVPGFAGAETLLGETVTGEGGTYLLSQELPAQLTRLAVRAVTGEGAEVPLVDPGRRLDLRAPLNLVAPREAVGRPESEHARLTADLAAHLGPARLGQAREDEQRRDLTVLHEATGWDARLIALAATADRLADLTGVPAPALYGMFRAGLPTEPALLAKVSGTAVGLALAKAEQVGLVELTAAGIEAAQQKFEAYTTALRRELPAPGTRSGFGEVLTAAGLTTGQQTTLLRLLEDQHEEPQGLWDAARQARLPVAKLQLAARLGYLTLDNAALIGELAAEVASPAELGPALVRQQLYHPKQWQQRLERIAGGHGEALAELIPAGYQGSTAERLAAYTGDLAGKVRRSYPTQVLSLQIKSGQLPLPGGDELLVAEVARMLDNAAAAGYRMGATPLNRFLREHGEQIFAGLPESRAAAATEQVRTLQRLYQVTPSDGALELLLELGFTTAHQIVEMSHQRFVERYGDRFASHMEASLTWRKAQVISVVTYSFLGAAKQAATAALPPAAAPPPDVVQQAKEDQIRQFPTLEELFGSLDFCECVHCRSVLSPAAYLVDLLKFLDPGEDHWDRELGAWKEAHGGATYPYRSKADWTADGSPAPLSPYQALSQRRPDLSQLPLTCENTTTVLPYLDIVNEILEYYLVNEQLDGAAAYDTGSADSADLIAEPQHLLPAAYDLLSQARYPLTLPFDLWLETVRGFAAHFETPLWQVLEALRTTDEPYPAAGDAYGRAAVGYERLGFASDELAVLTAADPLAGWRALYGYPASSSEAAVLAELAGAETLARRLGVSYRELVALVRTGVVNPDLETLATLRKLDISTEDVLRYHDHPGHAPLGAEAKAAFEQKLGAAGLAWVQQAYDAGKFARILVLADPVAGCGFDSTTLRYADGSEAEPMVFVLLNLFTRIWRRLGWTIEETDRALGVFLPGDPDPRTPAAVGPALASALLGLAHLDHLAEALKAGRTGRRDLLALWAPIDDARYAELFLTGTAQVRDEIFDDPLGRYLTYLDTDGYQPFWFDPELAEDRTTGTVGLVNHLGAVQAGLRLTTEEVGRILAANGLELASAPLNLATVSLLHRHVMLARLLKLSVDDLLALAELAGLDPFTAPPDGPVTSTVDDHAYRHAVGFVSATRSLQEAGWSVPELDYLLRHRFDPVGPYRVAATPPLALVRSLAAEITRIRHEYAVPGDPLTFTDEVVARCLALVLDPAVVTTFLAMWTGEEPLDPDFVEEHLRRREVAGVGEVGFLGVGDDAALFTPTPADQEAESTRRARLAGDLLPYLQDRLIRAMVVQTVAAGLAAGPGLVEALLTSPALLDDPDQQGRPLLASYAAAGRGLTVTGTGTGGTVSGYLEVPDSGPYRFAAAAAAAGTGLTLSFDHLPDPVLAATTTAGELVPEATVELRAGVPYGFTFTHAAGAATLQVQGGQLATTPVAALVTYPRTGVDHLHRVHLLVGKVLRIVEMYRLTEVELHHLLTHPDDFAGLDLGELPTRAADDTPARARALFDQLLRLAGWVRLRQEMAVEPDDLVELCRRARRRVPDGADPAATAEAVLVDVCRRLAALTRRDPQAVRDAADLLGVTATVDGDEIVVGALVDERGLHRLWRVLSLATRLGVDPPALGRWADPAPSAEVARDVRDGVQARYQPDQWRRVAQPIFDRLRQQRRDALVAHLLHTMGLDRVEQLFEYFLVDPGTEPVVQTSRLRLAISSVQTFIQRCLLNLEKAVHPSVLDSSHWQWMKRYRVWEANRKIFLWPENWLEPEFRDDKSHLFVELESALMESDLDRDDVEAAFLDYLRGLDEVARLDIRSTYLEEKVDPGSNVLHVLARTYQAPHKYFYRRYVRRRWTPWQPVTVDIESDHVAVVPWRDRVHVFWVTFMDEAEANAGGAGESNVTSLKIKQLVEITPRYAVRAQLSWSELFQGEWREPAASGFIMHSTHLAKRFDPSKEFVYAGLDADGRVWLALAGVIDRAFALVSKQSEPENIPVDVGWWSPYVGHSKGPGRSTGSGNLQVSYMEGFTVKGGQTTELTTVTKTILGSTGSYEIVTTPQRVSGMPSEVGSLVRPFFFADRYGRNTFFVEPTLTETTIEESDWFFRVHTPMDPGWDKPEPWEVELAPRYPIPKPDDWLAGVLPTDLVTQPDVLVRYGDQLVGAGGLVTAGEALAGNFLTLDGVAAAGPANGGQF